MIFLKYVMLLILFVLANVIGRILSQKYVYRLEELNEIKSFLNIFKTKIRFTCDTIPEIFQEFAEKTKKNLGKMFLHANEKMSTKTAGQAWESALDESKAELNLKEEDLNVMKMLAKMLGNTDLEGQISQIEITEKFLDIQIKQAKEEKDKNQKLYQKLGTTIGLGIVILLI